MSLSTTKMTSKGQVVIPEDIRAQLHLEPGTRFLVIGEKDYVIFKTLTTPSNAEFSDLLEKISKQARKAGLQESDILDAVQKVRSENS